MHSPKISICLITYNRKEYLKEAIDSVLAQIFSDWELIIIDNGSTDGSVEEIIKPYVDKDSRIKLYLNSKNRISYSRNLALSKCSGRYIAVIDSDDVWSNRDKLLKQFNFLENNLGYVLVGGWGNEIDKSSKETNKKIIYPNSDREIRKEMLRRNNFIHSAVMFRRDKVIECGQYDRSLCVGEDYDLWLRLGLLGKMYNIPDYFVKYRVHNNNINTPKLKLYIGTARVISRYRRYYPYYFYNLLKIIYFSVKHILTFY